MKNKEPTGLDAIGTAPICATCGSERVVRHAWACWNREAGLWELEQVLDDAYCHQCNAETKLQWGTPEQPATGRIRELNDAFRITGQGRGSVLITEGVSALGPEAVSAIMTMVRAFNDFSEDNDPWVEHDFGSFDHGNDKIFWKLDPYDLDLTAHSPNPANPAVTHRVLTVMLAQEY